MTIAPLETLLMETKRKLLKAKAKTTETTNLEIKTKVRLPNKINLVLFLWSGLLFMSCDSNRLYDEYVSIENGWKINEALTFSFKKPTVQSNCNLFFNVISNDDYRFNNIFLIVSLTKPSGLVHVDTLEYALADENGRLLGKGITDYKELKLWYKENYTFEEDGNYKVSVEQAVRQQNKIDGVEQLDGISKIGLRIEAASQQ